MEQNNWWRRSLWACMGGKEVLVLGEVDVLHKSLESNKSVFGWLFPRIGLEAGNGRKTKFWHDFEEVLSWPLCFSFVQRYLGFVEGGGSFGHWLLGSTRRFFLLLILVLLRQICEDKLVWWEIRRFIFLWNPLMFFYAQETPFLSPLKKFGLQLHFLKCSSLCGRLGNS